MGLHAHMSVPIGGVFRVDFSALPTSLETGTCDLPIKATHKNHSAILLVTFTKLFLSQEVD